MSRVCVVTGKRPMVGNNVSHANNKTKRRFKPNLHHHRFWIPSEERFIRLRVSTKGMRIIDKKGIEFVLSEIQAGRFIQPFYEWLNHSPEPVLIQAYIDISIG